MAARLGHNFDQVRVHTDAQAAEAAQAVNALAYTVGREIVFGANQYEPGTIQGRRLLAHELTHTVQQTPFRRRKDNLVRISDPTSLEEKEADVADRKVSEGRQTHVVCNTPLQIARNGPSSGSLPATPTAGSPKTSQLSSLRLLQGAVVHEMQEFFGSFSH
jgi:hypothetical protein